MKRLPIYAALIGALVIASAACGGGSTAGSGSTPTSGVSPSTNATATVGVGRTNVGQVLVDGKGLTLYLFVADTSSTSTCNGECAQAWPPLITSGNAHATGGASSDLLGATTRQGGKSQVTYKGHPLYYYVADKKPGDTTGQAINQFGALWYVLAPSGDAITSG